MLFFLLCLLILVIKTVDCVTPHNPCDPVRHVILHDVTNSVDQKNMVKYGIKPFWLMEPLRYIDCSRRGLTKIPQTLSTDVQILDLRVNAINEIKKDSFELYVSLQVLILYSNCIGDALARHLYCHHKSVFEQDAFSSLVNLKALDLGGNSFTSVPQNLPTSLEYLVLSRTGISQITKTDLSSFQNLSVFIADKVCFYNSCSTPFHMANDTFENLVMKFLILQENSGVVDAVSMIKTNITFLNLSATKIKKLQPRYFENFSALRRLELQFQFPNEQIHITVQKGTFDRLTNLEYLNLAGNLIPYLPKNLLQNNKNLKDIDLSGNCLQESVLDPVFIPANQIEQLYLGYNRCKKNTKYDVGDQNAPKILGASFSKMKNLKLLSFGKPSPIDQYIVDALPVNFRVVNNETVYVLKDLQNLEKFMILENQVDSLDMMIFSELKFLKYFHLLASDTKNITNTATAQHIPKKLPWKYQNHSISRYCSRQFSLVLSNNLIESLQSSWLVSSKIVYLGLESNLLQAIGNRTFKNLFCLESLNLRNNPLKFIHPNAFVDVPRLKYLYLSSTKVIQSQKSLYFFNYFQTSVFVELHFAKNNLYNLLCRYPHQTMHNSKVTKLDASNNIISQFKNFLEYTVQIFSDINHLTLQNCDIHMALFQVSAPHISHLDLSNNKIDKVTYQFLKGFPSLEILLLSKNKIIYFSSSAFERNPNLTHLDLSHNFIRQISFAKGFLKNLKELILGNNYIFDLSPKAFPLSFLSHLESLDLRWNSIECNCEVHQNFGQWLSKRAYKLSERPGLLPGCSSSVNEFGGCVKCTHTSCNNNQEALQQSLLQYSTHMTCSSFFNTILLWSFTSAVFLFMILGIVLNSSRCMVWLMKFATRSIRQSSDTDKRQTHSTLLAYHGFVLFDKRDINVSDWIDDCLLPTLTAKPPYFQIVVTGRDDQCGFPPVHQLVSKIEASRKVIVILTRSYAKSKEGQYAFCALETIKYHSGLDRAIIMTFENDPQVDDLLGKRAKINKWPVIKIPDSQNDLPIVWKILRNELQ